MFHFNRKNSLWLRPVRAAFSVMTDTLKWSLFAETLNAQHGPKTPHWLSESGHPLGQILWYLLRDLPTLTELWFFKRWTFAHHLSAETAREKWGQKLKRSFESKARKLNPALWVWLCCCSRMDEIFCFVFALHGSSCRSLIKRRRKIAVR